MHRYHNNVSTSSFKDESIYILKEAVVVYVLFVSWRSSRLQPPSFSNIELLVPLMVSDAVASVESDVSDAGERYERARLDKDMPFSNIPASEFVLDEVPVLEKKKREHKHSRKQDFAYWPRSVYLESVSSEESDERDERSEVGELSAQVWSACRRLTRAAAGRQHELLLLLCSELLDSSPTPPSPPHMPDCPCCQARGAPGWLGPAGPAGPSRRELVPIGEDPYL